MATAVPVPCSRATSSAAPVPVLETSMLRVAGQQLEPEPEPKRRHPVPEWRPHIGPTSKKHPRFPLSMPEPVFCINLHLAAHQSQHIVFCANKYACWLRCSPCERISQRFHGYTVCMKCPERRRDDHETSSAHVHAMGVDEMEPSSTHLFCMGRGQESFLLKNFGIFVNNDDFVEVDDSDNMEVFHDTTESDRHMTQTSCDAMGCAHEACSAQ